jgi:VLRF1 release factor-like protein
MVKGGPAAGGGRWIEVAPERTERWLTGFAERHGGIAETLAAPDVIRFTAADGSVAECRVPFPPLGEGVGLVEHALRERRVGVLLVRLGGYAAGLFQGERLLVSKVGARQVHGRSAAGGWSQQRFARRRDKQAREALEAAAEIALRVLGRAEPEAIVLGGDRRAVAELRTDRRLAEIFAKAVPEPFLTVPDPRLAILKQTPPRFRAVRIRLIDLTVT